MRTTYKHKLLGFTVEATGEGSSDTFVGTVVDANDTHVTKGDRSDLWLRRHFEPVAKKYFRHVRFGHVVELTAVGRTSDVFRGVVVEQGGGVHGAAVGTYSDMWIRDSFAPCDWYAADNVAIPADTIESMQSELDMLRLALGVDAEPLATLPERMLHAATVYRKLFVRVKEAINESR